MASTKSNHLQTLFDTLQKTSSQTKPRVCESVREKKGWASLKNSKNGHFSACGIRRGNCILHYSFVKLSYSECQALTCATLN